MIQHASDEGLVQVHITPCQDDGLPRLEEVVWASPVDADEGGGTYRLRHAAMTMPLTMDDVVTCWLDGRSRLQLVGVKAACSRMHTTVVAPAGTTPEEIQAVIESWTAGTDGYTWFGGRLAVTSWATGMTVEAVDDVLVADIDSRPDWAVLGLAEPHERTTEALAAIIDFGLDTNAPSGYEDGYWAPDDPAWAALGVTEPDELAAIQSLAQTDHRIVPAARSGQHADVLLLMKRLAALSPESLPPLQRPLFTSSQEPRR